MEKTNWWKIAVLVIGVLAIFGLGFYIGRKQEPETIIKTEIEYVQLPPVHDSIPYPVPYQVNVPADTADVIKAAKESGKYADLFPIQPGDTAYVSKEDSSAVIRDWGTERLYAETLFDSDTLGKVDINAKVQYNRLEHLDYTFTPIQKQTTNTVRVTRKFLPFIGAGLNTAGTFNGQGGMFFNQDAGFAVQYNYDPKDKSSSVGASFLYMF